MKKLKSLFIIAGIALLASCAKPSEKAAGTYNGDATVNSSTYPCTTIVTADGDNKTNVQATANSVTYTVNGVNVTLNNDVVTFTYSSNTTTSQEVTSVTGTVTGNALAMTITIMLSNPFTYNVVITGTK